MLNPRKTGGTRHVELGLKGNEKAGREVCSQLTGNSQSGIVHLDDQQ